MDTNVLHSVQKNFVKTIRGAFNLLLVKDEQPAGGAPTTTDVLPETLTREKALDEASTLPAEFKLVGLTDEGTQRTIGADDYIKAIHSCASLDNTTFQSQNPYQLELVAPLFEIFRDIVPEELNTFAALARKYIKNEDAVQYALIHAMLRREDHPLPATPSHITYKPHLYFEFGNLEYDQREDTSTLMMKPKFDYYGDTNVDLNARTDYFRLDPGINAHHRHWHEAYMDMPGTANSTEKVYRGGELFYYMHSQMVARYNFERLSCGLFLTESHDNFYLPMSSGHFNKLTTDQGAKLWDSRPPKTVMKDVIINDSSMIKLSDLELARDRIYDAIDREFCHVKVVENGKVTGEKLEKLNQLSIPPTFKRKDWENLMDYGIDKLGDMVWPYPPRSRNFQYYGSLHNNGHVIIAYSHDPDGLYHRSSQPGVMASNETAPRDHMFYAWHSFIDDIFVRYKATLPQYDVETELEFPKVEITSLDLVQNGTEQQDCLPVIETKWFIDRVDITAGVDAARKKLLKAEKLWYQYIHLGHEEFKYKFTIDNQSAKTKLGTVRIFLAPYYVSRYRSNEPKFNEFRRMFIEMDKYVVTMLPGVNDYERSSKDSNVTVATENIFLTPEQAAALNEAAANQGTLDANAAWCGCGWPEYLLVGKGTREGLKCCLFMMVTDYAQDKVDYNWDEKCSTGGCEVGMSYCGRRNKRYPDRKPMGYPFDRNVKDDDLSMDGFVTKTRNEKEPAPVYICNMKKIDIYVKHVGKPEVTTPGPTMGKK